MGAGDPGIAGADLHARNGHKLVNLLVRNPRMHDSASIGIGGFGQG
jgi:hypothetical protein